MTRWKVEEDAYLLGHYKSKEDLPLVAKVLGRSEESCRQRIYKVKQSKFRDQKMNEGLALEEHYFSDRTNTKRLKPIQKIPKGASSTAKASPQGGRGNAYRHTKTGYRADIGELVRSGWEANVCRILKAHQIPYEYEPLVFQFPVKRGNKSYKPDFYLPVTNEWIEVKGYFDKASMIKMKRFKIYYPDEWANLTMIVAKGSKATLEFCEKYEVPNVMFYQDLEKLFKNKINNWEGPKR